MRKKKKAVLTELQAMVMSETKNGLQEIAEKTGMTIGEVIDRITVRMRPYTLDLAVQLAQEEMTICLSGLTTDDFEKAFYEILVSLMSVVGTDQETLEQLTEAAKEKREQLMQNITSLSEDEQKALRDSADEFLRDGKQQL